MPTDHFVESAFWNFDAMFVPQQHPARELQDTFYVAGECRNGDVFDICRAIHFNYSCTHDKLADTQIPSRPTSRTRSTTSASPRRTRSAATGRSGTARRSRGSSRSGCCCGRTRRRSRRRCCTRSRTSRAASSPPSCSRSTACSVMRRRTRRISPSSTRLRVSSPTTTSHWDILLVSSALALPCARIVLQPSSPQLTRQAS